MTKISKEEFCCRTFTSENSWIFNEYKDPEFYSEGKSTYMHTADKIYEFQNMPQYGEIWARYRLKDGQFGLFNTWHVYD